MQGRKLLTIMFVAGVESVLRSLGTSLELKNPTLLKLGYSLLAEILQR